MKLDPSPQLRLSIQQFDEFIHQHWKQPSRLAATGPETIWQQALNDNGWNVPDWPVDLGGTDWTAMQRYHWYQATCRAACPQGDILAKELIGPLLFNFARPQQMGYLDGIRTGSDAWGLARLNSDHQINPIYLPAKATKLMFVFEQAPGQSSLMIVQNPQSILSLAGTPQLSKNWELLGKAKQAHAMMTTIQLKYQPIAAICRTAGAIEHLEPLLDQTNTTAQERKTFSEILIAQHSIEIYCQRILSNMEQQKLLLITRAARKIMDKIKGLNQSLAGYYSLTDAQKPGENYSNQLSESGITDTFEYCEPLDLFDSFSE
jgi:hypothetical protein